ncbi:ATP-binding protein [Nocardia sp. NPDC052566]|uniref:ATP-binding protein n=1 Tax=Nocardia sp. NPDC052566 TaxID=3364330 RepID=UPI0037CA4930
MAMIGRDHAALLLRDVLRRTVSSHGALVLVAGEAGIGKTTLVTEVVGEFDEQRALVLTATAWNGTGTPGFWPWVQVLRGLRRVVASRQWADVDEALETALSMLFGSVEQEARTGSDITLFRIGDAVTEALVAASALRPVFVVIDDLHRADPESVELLAFVARHSWFERLAIVATVRDTEALADTHPLRDALGELATGARSIDLTGLSEGQTATVVAAVTGRRPPAEVTRTMHVLTGGNPFLVEQAARLWDSGNPLDALSPGVRHTLDARLAVLSAAAVDALTTAALLGREFSAPLLASATGQEVNGPLAAAARARLVTQPDPDHHAFVHDLIREALISRLSTSETRKRHAAIVSALERLPVEPGTMRDLAHHAYLAADAIDAERALRYLLDAAANACGRLASGEVAQHYRRALTLIEEDRTELRGEVGLGLAAAYIRTGKLATARHTYETLLVQARSTCGAALFARAVLGLHDLGLPDPEHDAERQTELMDQAHRMLVAERPHSDPLAVQVLAAATRVRVHTTTALRRPEVGEMSAEVLRLARQSGDNDTLAAGLLARHDALWRPGTAADRLALSEELVGLGRMARRDEVELQGELLRFVALLELGDPRVHAELTAFSVHADRSSLPRFRFVALSRSGAFDAMLGRFDDAQTKIDGAYALGERLGEVDRIPLWLEQRWALALLMDDPVEMARLVERYRELAGEYTVVPDLITACRCGDVARIMLLLGDVQALFGRYPRHFRAGILAALAHAAIVVDDPELRKSVRECLIPLRGLWAVVAGGGACYGPYGYWLGRVAAAMGDLDTAAAELRAAAESAKLLRARPWLSAAEHQLRLLTHGRPPPPPQRAVPLPDNEFRLDAAVWTLRFADRTVRLPDAKGLRDLHVLLGHPGYDIPSLELFGAADAATLRAARSLGADPVLDEQAKSAYRRRLSTLDAEIDRAAELGADDRAAELDRERTALLDELRRAAGLAGRPRRLGDDAERARKTVSARVRDAMRRIDRLHPELAEHLRASVSLGVVCRYAPHREVRWAL